MSTLAEPRISDDLRYELADAARAAELGNRPRSLLILATLLFLITGVALVATLRTREAAARQLESQSYRKALVDGLALQFDAVERRMHSADISGNAPLTDLLSRIEKAASDAGLRDSPKIPQPNTSKTTGGTKNLYTYAMQDPSLENLLAWVEGAKANVPGLEVSSIEIVPAPKVWKFNVTFVRWERSP